MELSTTMRGHLRALVLTSLLCAALALAASCGASTVAQPDTAQPRAAAAFSAELLPGCDLGGGDPGVLSAEVSESAEGALVELRLDGARELRALYLRLSYDASRWALLDAAPTELAAQRAELLALADSSRPGIVEYGQVKARALEGRGFSGSGTVARIRFARGAAAPLRALLSAPQSSRSALELDYDLQSATVSFLYANQGDYDQNGLVSIADLTPLGIRLNTEVESPGTLGAHIDGDGNGFITLADLTPIGANFGRSALGGFAVYRSSNPGDYPGNPTAANGPGTALAGIVPFDSAQNADDAANQRLFYTFDASDPGGLYLWVRPGDGSEVGICSNLITAGPPIEAELVDGLIGAGDYSSLAIVNGRPAIAYQRGASRDLWYVRASDATGSAWGQPQLLDGSGVSNGLDPCLKVINGRPAVSYWFADQSDLRYIRASDANGDSWGAFVPIDAGNNSGQWSSLAEVNGRPAISYYNDTAKTLSYVRALDSDGAAWGGAVTADDRPFNGGYSSLAVVQGNPAIAYHQFPFGDDETGLLRYVRASDVNGVSWPADGLTLDEHTQFQGLYPQLLISAGNPAVLHYDQSSGNLRFVRANDTEGTDWGDGIVAVAGAPVSERFQAGLIDGCAAVAWHDVTNDDLRFCIAIPQDGGQWQPLRILDGNSGAGLGPALIEMPDGSAGVSYGRVDTGLQFLSFEP